MKILALAALLLTGCGGGAGLPPVPQAPAAFAVVGDSISAGAWVGEIYVNDFANAWPAFASALTGRPVYNVSVSGGQVPQMIAQEVPLIPATVTTVVFAGGTNDIPHCNCSTTTLLARIDAMVASIHTQAPRAEIIFLDVRSPYSPSDPTPSVYGNATNGELYAKNVAWNDREKALGRTVDIQDRDRSSFDAAGVQQYPDNVHPTLAEAHNLAALVAPLMR